MALGAVLAAALTDHAARTWGLWVDGVDLSRGAVQVETVALEVAGPGGVSTLSFRVDDPAIAIAISDGSTVRMHDLANDLPLFVGWVQHYAFDESFGNQGREIVVDAVGAESLLDWYVTSYPLVWPGIPTTPLTDMIASIIASASPGLGELRVIQAAVAQGTQATPMGHMGGAYNQTIPLTIPIGTPLRQAIAQASQVCVGSVAGFLGALVSVDQTLGLRVFADLDPYVAPDGDAQITTRGDLSATSHPSRAHYEVDASSIVRQVIVQGAAGVTATAGDGSGKRGPTAVLSDATITTAAAALAAGAAYLANNRTGIRSELDLEDDAFWTLGGNDVFRRMALTDPAIGIAAPTNYPIRSIRFRFYGAKRDMHISFGGQAPSAAQLMRRLTRGTLS